MDSNSINNTSNSSSSMQTSIDRFFPTSTTTSPHHFFDTTTFLEDAPPSFPTSTATSSWAQPPTPEPATKTSAAAPGPTGRPSKKRSRASRRAPTTVLTTDTSNFRAMVQEFTGIPSPPFTSPTSLHFPRTHLIPPPTSFLPKPFRHKFQPPPTSPLPPINFQSLLQSQQQQAIASSSSSSSGELRLPGVIGSGCDQTRQQQQQQQQQDAIASCKMNFPGSVLATEFHAEKGSTEGLMDSWICSSD